MPCSVAGDHKRSPVGVGTPRRVNVSARPWRVAPPSAYAAKTSCTTPASYGSTVTRAVGVDAVAVGHVRRPRQELAGAELGQPTAAHAVGDERALVLGHGPADLRDQLLVGIAARRAVDEDHLDPSALPLVQHHHL